MSNQATSVDHSALYIIENAFNSWLQDQDDVRIDYQRMGIPGIGIRLVDQLLYNRSYFAIQFSNMVVGLNLVRTDDSKAMSSVKEVVSLLLGKSASSTERLSEKNWTHIARAFQDGRDAVYLPPRLDIAEITKSVEALDDPLAALCWNRTKRRLKRESEFYDCLRGKRHDRGYLDPRHQTDATWPLACYRVLIPYWVDREVFAQGLAKTIYTSEFWSSYEDFGQMVERLFDYYKDTFKLTSTQANMYREWVMECHERLTAQGGNVGVEPVDAYKELDIEQLFKVEQFWFKDEFVKNPILAPGDSWLAMKSTLISAVMCPAFMGQVSLLGEDERAIDTVTFYHKENSAPNLDEGPIEGNWGELPISIQVAADPAPVSTTVNLDGSKTDGPVLMLGRGHGGFWEDWAKVLIKGIEGFYTSQKDISTGEDDSGGKIESASDIAEDVIAGESLIGSMIEEAVMEASDEYEASGFGELPTGRIATSILKALKKFLENCGDCYARDTRSAHEKKALLPSLERIVKETLSSEEVVEFDSPNAHDAALKHLTKKVKAAADYFLRTVRAKTDDPSPIMEIVEDRLEMFESDNPGDPSAGYFYNGIRLKDGSMEYVGLRERLIENLKENGRTSCEQLASVIEAAAHEYSDYERSHYVSVIDAQISRRHALLLLDDGVLQLADVGSKNGTALKRSSEESAHTVLFPRLPSCPDANGDSIDSVPWVSAKANKVRRAPVNHGDTIYLAGAATLSVR